MKVNIINITEEPKFNPVQLNITIESLDELKLLWHRFNINANHFTAEGTAPYDSHHVHSIENMRNRNSADSAIWSKIDTLLENITK